MTEASRQLFEMTEKQGATIVTIIPSRVVSEEDIQQFATQLNHVVVDNGRSQLVIDFGKVKFLSSAALGRLVALKKRIREAKGTLKLCCIDSNLLEVFRITRLDSVFEIHKDLASALARP
jgi:anti-sigma B factor antagonist